MSGESGAIPPQPSLAYKPVIRYSFTALRTIALIVIDWPGKRRLRSNAIATLHEYHLLAPNTRRPKSPPHYKAIVTPSVRRAELPSLQRHVIRRDLREYLHVVVGAAGGHVPCCRKDSPLRSVAQSFMTVQMVQSAQEDAVRASKDGLRTTHETGGSSYDAARAQVSASGMVGRCRHIV